MLASVASSHVFLVEVFIIFPNPTSSAGERDFQYAETHNACLSDRQLNAPHVLLLAFSKNNLLAIIKNNNTIIIFLEPLTSNVEDSSQLHRTIWMEGKKNMYRHHASSTGALEVVYRFSQRAAAHLINIVQKVIKTHNLIQSMPNDSASKVVRVKGMNTNGLSNINWPRTDSQSTFVLEYSMQWQESWCFNILAAYFCTIDFLLLSILRRADHTHDEFCNFLVVVKQSTHTTLFQQLA